MSLHRTSLVVAARATALVLASGAAAVAVGTRAWQAATDLASPVPRTESGLVALAGAAALVVLARIALLAVTVAAPAVVAGLRGRPLPRIDRRAGLGRLVAGVVLGAASLAPQPAAAAPTHAPGVVRTMAADTGPVDPTYLGPTVTADVDARAGEARTSAPPGPVRAPHADARFAGGSETVAVASGDTLWGIALARLVADGHPAPGDAQVARAVLALYAANRAAVGDDPDLIVPGTRLVLPDLAAAAAGPAPTEGTR